jgi:hypothetical protein
VQTRSDREGSSAIEERDEMNISKVFGADRLQNDKHKKEKKWQERATSHLIRYNKDN